MKDNEVEEAAEPKEYTSSDLTSAIVITAMSTFAILMMVVNGAII